MHNVLLLNLILLVLTMVFVVLMTIGRRRNLAWIMREASVISKAAAIPGLKGAMADFERELARARRNERPLTVAVLEIEGNDLVENIGILIAGNADSSVEAHRQAMQTVRVVFLLLGAILRDAMRESDIIAYDVVNDDYVIMMPDSTKSEAAAAIERMQLLLRDRTMANSRAGFAEFPKDVLTLERLITTARAACTPLPAAASTPVEAAA